MQRFQERERRKWQREEEVNKWHERHNTENMYSDITFGRRGFVSLNQNDADESSNQAIKKIFDRRNRRKRRKVSFYIVLSLFRHSLS